MPKEKVKRYTSLPHFIKEMAELKDGMAIFKYNIEEQINRLDSTRYKELKEDIKRLNIKVIIEKDMKKGDKYER